LSVPDIFGSGDVFNFGDIGAEIGRSNKRGKRKQKSGFDEIFNLAGLGGEVPFAGFDKRTAKKSPDDFAVPVRRKRRSKEAVLLGIREDAQSPIFGLQFLGNAVGSSESFLDSKEQRLKRRR